MRKVIVYIAQSLDGFIAGPDGNVDWLEKYAPQQAAEQSYESFIQNVDTVIMGWKTYHQIAAELSAGEWIYKGMKTWVITHRNMTSDEQISFTDENPASLISHLQKEDGKDIWICGGASLIRQLLDEDRIDLLQISVLPVLLGNGIRLFSSSDKTAPLLLLSVQDKGGMAEILYQTVHQRDA